MTAFFMKAIEWRRTLPFFICARPNCFTKLFQQTINSIENSEHTFHEFYGILLERKRNFELHSNSCSCAKQINFLIIIQRKNSNTSFNL